MTKEEAAKEIADQVYEYIDFAEETLSPSC